MSDPAHLIVESPRGTRDVRVTAASSKKSLTEILRHEGLPLNTRCGQRGLCEGCVIELIDGSLAHVGTHALVKGNGAPRSLRACEYAPAGHASGGAIRLRVPQRSLLVYQPQVVSEFKLNVPRAHDPLCRWDDKSGLVEFDGQRGRVNDEVKAAPASILGAAVDVGTTTVAVMIVDMTDGKIVGRSAAFNAQMHLGDDVITRINLCSTDPAMLGRLQEAIVNETLAPLLAEALTHAHQPADHLRCVCIAGNTTMQHLIAGVDPTPMGFSPFTPRFLGHKVVRASELKLAEVPTRCAVHLLPGAAAYVGADLTAGIIASGMLYNPQTSMLVDVGTNGEIILKHGDHLYGCATAAGPAFEGARLASGVRAGKGAIAHVTIDRHPGFAVHTQVIGGGKPHGICGSAYVDFLAQARHAGLIGHTGRFEPGVADDRITQLPGCGKVFKLAEARGGEPIQIAEADLANLLQAKAAIAAGILTLLNRVGLQPGDVHTLYLAGGFGMHMNVEHAIACGLLPRFTKAQVQLVGNTALGGAYMALMDSGAALEMARIGARMQIVELNLDPQFESTYIEQLALP